MPPPSTHNKERLRVRRGRCRYPWVCCNEERSKFQRRQRHVLSLYLFLFYSTERGPEQISTTAEASIVFFTHSYSMVWITLSQSTRRDHLTQLTLSQSTRRDRRSSKSVEDLKPGMTLRALIANIFNKHLVNKDLYQKLRKNEFSSYTV